MRIELDAAIQIAIGVGGDSFESAEFTIKNISTTTTTIEIFGKETSSAKVLKFLLLLNYSILSYTAKYKTILDVFVQKHSDFIQLDVAELEESEEDVSLNDYKLIITIINET